MKPNPLRIVAICLIVALGAFDFYLSLTQWDVTAPEEEVATETPTPTPTPTAAPTPLNEFAPYDRTGAYKKDDYIFGKELTGLNLFELGDIEFAGASVPKIYAAGKVASGDFAGKSLIFVGENTDLVNDYAPHYIVDNGDGTYFSNTTIDQDTYNYHYTSKVTVTTKKIVHAFEQRIELGTDDILTISGVPDDYIYSDYKDTGTLSGYAVDAGGYVLKTRTKLGTVGSLTLYSSLPEAVYLYWGGDEGITAEEQANQKLVAKYLTGTTEVLAVDTDGTALTYTLGSKLSESYIKSLNEEYSPPPSYDFVKSQVNGATVPLFTSYKTGVIRGCSIPYETSVLNSEQIKDTDLAEIGKLSDGSQLYLLSNKDHEFYKTSYVRMETAKALYGDEIPNTENGELSKQPTLAAYVAKNPVVMRKDYFGRLISLQEHHYITVDGYGKPVVYLYPTEPTKVDVSLQVPVEFSVDIPTYTTKWSVEAQPNGMLKDLQPSATNCSTLPTARGAEYAKQACASGMYPYLYWAGSISSRVTTTQQAGWSVAAADVEKTLSEKLVSIGLNDTERKDMLEYWVPTLLAKKAPYYRLSFLQTPEVSKLFPLRVSPTPETSIRIFLDWEPLTKNISIAPQNLQKVERKGFTLVEWGGLKR